MRLKNLSLALAVSLAIPALALAWQAPSASRPRPDATAQRPAPDPLQEAEDLLQKQQYVQAEEELQPLMTVQARNPQAWFDLGFAQSHQGKTKEAVASYQKAVALAPDWFEANLNLGLELAFGPDFKAAARVLKHTVELKPSSNDPKVLGRAWLALADTLESSDPKSAVAAYDKAAELGQLDAELDGRAAWAQLNAGDPAGAEQRLKKAAEAGSGAAMGRLVVLLAGQHRDAEAAEWMKKQNPQDAMSLGLLASLLRQAGKNEEAISTLQTIRTKSPDPGIDRELAALYLDTKQYDKAENILQELAQKQPNDVGIRWALGRALLHQHKYPEAEKEMFEALRINPQIDLQLEGDPWELAYAAQQNKHYELAIRVLDARAQRLQETPTTYWIRAVCYDSLGAVKPAAANYRLFLDADAGKSPDQEFQARHRLKAIEPQR